jgi:hypothetical protein
VLAWNQRKVRLLTPGEIWLFIVGRGLLAFGAGILLVRYVPSADAWGVPSLVAGLLCLVVAAKGLRRQAPDEPSRPAA